MKSNSDWPHVKKIVLLAIAYALYVYVAWDYGVYALMAGLIAFVVILAWIMVT